MQYPHPSRSQGAGTTYSSARASVLRRNTQYAFTLLELMLVTVIILALVTISTPLFKRTYEDLKLTSSAKEMAAIMRFCRERAVFERRPYRLSIDIDKKTYRIFTENEESEFEPLKERWGRVFKLSDDINIETEVEKIDFSPDGNPTPTLIYLTNREDETHTILIEQNTGLVRVYDYKKE